MQYKNKIAGLIAVVCLMMSQGVFADFCGGCDSCSYYGTCDTESYTWNGYYAANDPDVMPSCNCGYGDYSYQPEMVPASAMAGPDTDVIVARDTEIVEPGSEVVVSGPAVVAPGPDVVVPSPAVVEPGPGVIAPGPGVIVQPPAVVAPAPGVIVPNAPVVVAP